MGRLFSSFAILLVAAFMVMRPEDVPDRWNPFAPLDLNETPNVISRMKVRALGSDPEFCRDVMKRAGARVEFEPDHDFSKDCHIRNRTRVGGLSKADMSPMATTCEMAARMYLWERHSLQAAARRHLGVEVARIHHFDSYSCRAIRTANGSSGRMSEHATANAVDISGFTLTDGRRISLVRDWGSDDEAAAFLRAARDGLCDWFNLVLSPDYNTLHADHFHADMGLWPGCR